MADPFGFGDTPHFALAVDGKVMMQTTQATTAFDILQRQAALHPDRVYKLELRGPITKVIVGGRGEMIERLTVLNNGHTTTGK